jgi:hypothetical protein
MLSNGSGEKTAILTYFTKKAIDLGEQHLVAKHIQEILLHKTSGLANQGRP